MLPPTHRPRGLRFLGRGAALTLALGLASLPATAQWSTDPAVNLVLSDRSGEQVQPKVAATADGGAYVSWFDNADGGYDVYLQRLDARGFEQWAHNGILIADRSYSSTQDYGLTVDTAGNALLAYRDDQGAFERVSAFKVSPAGTPLWGPNGIQLTNAPASVGRAVPLVARGGDHLPAARDHARREPRRESNVVGVGRPERADVADQRTKRRPRGDRARREVPRDRAAVHASVHAPAGVHHGRGRHLVARAHDRRHDRRSERGEAAAEDSAAGEHPRALD